jgi:hypothetical protein
MPRCLDDPEALLAGTLCLMSCPGSADRELHARRIVANLERLAVHPEVSTNLRTVCRRLASQWEQRLDLDALARHAATPH